MIILRTKKFTDEELDTIEESTNDEVYGKPILGTLYISKYNDKTRFIGKNCLFKVSPDLIVSGNNDPKSKIFWRLDKKFETSKDCPNSWKEILLSGQPEYDESLDANVRLKNGSNIEGRVIVKSA